MLDIIIGWTILGLIMAKLFAIVAKVEGFRVAAKMFGLSIAIIALVTLATALLTGKATLT